MQNFAKFLTLGVFMFGPQLAVGAFLPESLSTQLRFHAQDGDRIVGGIAAKKGELPYQVSLQTKSQSTGIYHHFCGGTLVSHNCVVTAAHCAEGRSAGSLSVVGGSLTLDGTALAVKEITVNPAYDSSTVFNDIAVLQLVNLVTFTDQLKAIPVAMDKAQTPAGTLTTVSGWGTMEEMGDLSDNLLYTDVPVITDAECRAKYGQKEIADSMICAGSDQGGKDSCQGDSGGPLVAGSGADRKLVGIVSWGYGCARKEYPGVYTQVSYFTDFLKKQNCI